MSGNAVGENRYQKQLRINKLVVKKYRFQSLNKQALLWFGFCLLFGFNFNLQPPIPSPPLPLPTYCTYTHSQAMLESHPLAFSTDSYILLYLMTLHMPFSLRESLLLPFIYLVGSQVFLESKLKHYLHILKPFLTTVEVRSASSAPTEPDSHYHTGLWLAVDLLESRDSVFHLSPSCWAQFLEYSRWTIHVSQVKCIIN